MPRKVSKRSSKRRYSKKRSSKSKSSKSKRKSQVKSYYKKYQHGGNFFNKSLTGQLDKQRGGEDKVDATDHAAQINQVIEALTEKLQNITCNPQAAPADAAPEPEEPEASPTGPVEKPPVDTFEFEEPQEGGRRIGFGGRAATFNQYLGLL